MSAPKQPIVVTGLGMITPMGVGKKVFWEGIMAGRSTADLVPDFDPETYPTAIACQVDDKTFDPSAYVKKRKSLKVMGRSVRFAVAAAAMALQDAAAVAADLDPLRCGVAMGTGGVGLHDSAYLKLLTEICRESISQDGPDNLLALSLKHLNPLTPLMTLPNLAAGHIAIEHGFRGENVTVCTACTSSTQAIGEAMRLMQLGHADLMVAGGADAMINSMGLIGFGMLGVLSRRNGDPARASRPFDAERDGFVMGEGGVALVLETLTHARRRGAPVLAELRGYGNCSDAYRITDGREDGDGNAEAMRRALADADTAPECIDYINAHGTGTRLNDRNEVLAIKKTFGDHARTLSISSTKSQVGHMIAAAGAVESATCVLALQNQVMPATINNKYPDPECDLDVVPNKPRSAPLETVISNSFGFGGQNACLVLGRGGAL